MKTINRVTTLRPHAKLIGIKSQFGHHIHAYAFWIEIIMGLNNASVEKLSKRYRTTSITLEKGHYYGQNANLPPIFLGE